MPFTQTFRRWTTQKPPLPTLINWAHPLARGLIDAWTFREGGGLTIFDAAGFNHGALTKDAGRWAGTPRGGTYSFDNSGGSPLELVNCGTAIPLFGAGDFTVVVGANLTNVGTGFQPLICRGDTTPTRGWFFELEGTPDTGNPRFVLFDGTNAPDVTEVADQRGAYHVFAATKQPSGSGGLTLFVDGTLRDTQATYTIGTYENAADPVYIASRADSRPTGFDHTTGPIEFVYLYNRALTASEHLWLALEPYALFQPYRLIFGFPASPQAGYLLVKN